MKTDVISKSRAPWGEERERQHRANKTDTTLHPRLPPRLDRQRGRTHNPFQKREVLIHAGRAPRAVRAVGGGDGEPVGQQRRRSACEELWGAEWRRLAAPALAAARGERAR